MYFYANDNTCVMKHICLAIIPFLFSHFTSVDWKTLENSEYSIKYADNWAADQSGQAGTKFILYGPVIEGQLFRNNINLIVQDLAGQNIDLAKYLEISTGQIKTMIASSNILSSKTEKSCHKIVYTGMYGDYNLKWMQYYWVQNDKAYVLTFTADKNSFDTTVSVASQQMDSFIIK